MIPMDKLPEDIAGFRRAKILEHQIAAIGTLHLGAHMGQERESYRALGKPVVWVEANPEVFVSLSNNIAQISGQTALCALLGETDGKQQSFHISNNTAGISSSIYPFGEYAASEKSLWPELDLKMVATITLPEVRLDTLLSANGIQPEDYDFWVLDLQGSEMHALAGAVKSLAHCKCLLAEVSEVEIYRGAPLYQDLKRHLVAAGFTPAWEPHLPHDDVLFVR
jgi:FkbM family methyltransferase